MTEVKITDGYIIVDEGIFENDSLYGEGNRIAELAKLLSFRGAKKKLILGKYEAQFYQLFEENHKWAFTLDAVIEKIFTGDDRYGVKSYKVEKDLNKMVEAGKINGVYFRGCYYYYYKSSFKDFVEEGEEEE